MAKAKKKADQIDSEKKNRLLLLLFSILLGTFGVDRFYMGQTGLALLKLITFGGFGIWYLADICFAATGEGYAKGTEWKEFA